MMSADGTYNGYANYQTWNVCLWISNDQGFNQFASVCKTYEDFKTGLREMYSNQTLGYETPDGIAWNDSNVNLAELQEYWQENFSQVCS